MTAIDPAEVESVPVLRPLDPLTPLGRVDRLPEGRSIGGPEEARTWRRAQCVLGGALLVGLAAGTMEMAVAYAKQREQFGKPIGSFQAVKHLCADMLVAAETARAAVQAAAVTIDQPGVGDPDRAAYGAGLLASEAAIKNGKTSIQVHGGMGFTWEVPAHLYLMRARVLSEAIGPVDGLAQSLAEIFCSRIVEEGRRRGNCLDHPGRKSRLRDPAPHPVPVDDVLRGLGERPPVRPSWPRSPARPTTPVTSTSPSATTPSFPNVWPRPCRPPGTTPSPLWASLPASPRGSTSCPTSTSPRFVIRCGRPRSSPLSTSSPGAGIIIGVGAGHVVEEFEILGPEFLDRGKALDESIDGMAAALSDEFPILAGPRWPASGLGIGPRPLQQPRPPSGWGDRRVPLSAGLRPGVTGGFPRRPSGPS